MLRSAIIGVAVTSVGAADLTVIDGKCTIDSSGCMLSPSYPRPYPSKEQCNVLIGAGVLGLKVVDFMTEPGKDVLMIDGVAYSGYQKPPVVLDANGGELVWRSNEQATRGGWKICPADPADAAKWSVTAPCGFCADGCITSPNYPQAYGVNQHCHITYAANFGKVRVEHFDVDTSDFLGHMHGGIGASVPVKPKSAIQWFADDSVSKKGWKLCPLWATPAAAAQAQCPVSTGAPKTLLPRVVPKQIGTVGPLKVLPPRQVVPQQVVPQQVVPAVAQPQSVESMPVVGGYSMESAASTASQSPVLAFAAVIAAVAGFAVGSLAFRRRMTSNTAGADHRPLTLEADRIEAGAETASMIQ